MSKRILVHVHGGGGEEFLLSTRLLLSMNVFMQEHCHSSLDNHSRLGYRLERWNGFPSHITADLVLSLRWTDDSTDSDLHSPQLEIQVQSTLNLI